MSALTGEPAATKARVGWGFIALLALAYFGLNAAVVGALANLLPRLVQTITGPDGKEQALAIVLGVGACGALLASPALGDFSDRTVSRFGARRPWIGFSAVAVPIAFVVLSQLESVPVLAVCWLVAQVVVNAGYMSLFAVVPDVVPASQRATVTGVMAVATTAGSVVGVMLVAFAVVTVSAGFWLLGAIYLVSMLPLLLAWSEPASTGVMASQRFTVSTTAMRSWRPRAYLRQLWVNPRAYPDFARVWWVRFFFALSIALTTNFSFYFLQDRIGLDVNSASRAEGLLVGALALAGLCTAAVAGVWSDRVGKRVPFVVAAGLIVAVGCAVFAYSLSLPIALAAAIIVGAGLGVFQTTNQALLTLVLPGANTAGRAMGVANVAVALPQVFAPAVAALLVTSRGPSALGYPLLFGLAAVMALGAAFLVRRVVSVR